MFCAMAFISSIGRNHSIFFCRSSRFPSTERMLGSRGAFSVSMASYSISMSSRPVRVFFSFMA
jgi:hypothetical protein